MVRVLEEDVLMLRYHEFAICNTIYEQIFTLAGGGTSSAHGKAQTVSWQHDPSILNSVDVSSPLIICAHWVFMDSSAKHCEMTGVICAANPIRIDAKMEFIIV